jgi:hypothetical protein
LIPCNLRKYRLLQVSSSAKVKELDYRPNWVARSLVTQRTHVCGVVVPNLSRAIFPDLLGHPEASRHLSNLNLQGTIKELAQLDGGFVVSREGIVLSACRYLDAVAAQARTR